MAVSLSMLQFRLTQFSVENHDDHKRKDIHSFCLFSSNISNREHTLYVGMHRDFFPLHNEGDPEEITLYYEGDYLLLHTTDKVVVVNELLSIFSLYDHWENSLTQLIASGCSPQELLDVSDDIFDTPLLVLDQTDYIFAVSKKYETIPVDPQWFEMLERRSTTTENILLFHDMDQKLYSSSSREPFYLESFFPRPTYSINLFSGDELLGILVMVEYEHPFHEGMVDEFVLLSSYICKWIEQNASSDSSSREQSYLLDVIFEQANGVANLQRLLAMRGWKEEHTLQLFITRAISPVFYVDAFLCRVLTASSPYICAAPLKEGCLVLCNLSKMSPHAFFSLFEQWLKQSKYYYGSSTEFTGLDKISTAYKQAQVALDYGTPESTARNSVLNAALPYMLDTLRDTIPPELCHPVVSKLAEYDEQHGTDLQKTLFVYLLNRQNHVIAAEQLHIHRNTLNQRITRLTSLFQIDFSDAELCLYLLLSLYISSKDYIDLHKTEKNAT